MHLPVALPTATPLTAGLPIRRSRSTEDTPLAALWAGIRTLRYADGPDEVHIAQYVDGRGAASH